MGIRDTEARAAVVLFARMLHARPAGGARAVFERASLYSAAGYDVHLVVTSPVSASNLAQLRRAKMLHHGVRVHDFAAEGPGYADWAEAAERAPLSPPRIAEPGPAISTRVEHKTNKRGVLTFKDGVLRSEEWTTRNGGVPQVFHAFDEHGARVQSWRYADGKTVLVHDVDPVTGATVATHYIVEGRYCWLSTVADNDVGTGASELHTTGERLDFGTVLARWLDRAFAHYGRVVVLADGENTWQQALRRMEHPGVYGVSILHNSHLDAPYDQSAPTKDHWRHFFEDRTNVHAMVCLTHRQYHDLRARYGDLPLTIANHAAPTPRRIKVRRHPKRVVYVGRLAAQKRLDHLIDMFSLVVEEVPDAVLDVFGLGPEFETLQGLIERHGLQQSVRLRGYATDPLKALASARVAVATSQYEGWQLTITEAMSVGTPYVSYDVNYGPGEIIRDGVDGFLVPPGDIRACAARVVAVLRDDALASKLSTRALEVGQRFSRERYRRTWLRVLDAALRGEPVPSGLDDLEDGGE